MTESKLVWLFIPKEQATGCRSNLIEMASLVAMGATVTVSSDQVFMVTFPDVSTRKEYIQSATRSWRIAP